ncbi:MAG: SDR family NAD(P)-dependent oxidoreductase [Cytophagales bacterium]|nr:MAG: SDR family NAD(P)-dependent oxidoreductase [Cytophagales bacterium]
MNKTILVTGGTKGIGRSIIELFAQSGFNIITCSRNEDELESLRNDVLNKNSHVLIYTKKVDLSIKKDIENFVHYIDGLNLKIDILVNNAGQFIPGQIHTEEEGRLEHLIKVNLYSAYYISKAILPQMIARKSGHLFNICSTASITPYINGGSYCISKFALLGMTKVLREEMKNFGIKVTAVLPGATYTDSWSGVDIPPERFMPSDAIAESIYSIYHLKGATNVEEILIRPQLGDI